MKKFFTLISAVAMMFAANANTLDVCMGENLASALPIYGLWADTENTLGQMIYPADMLEDIAGGEITGIQFYTSINGYEALGYEAQNGERDYINFDDATIQLSLMVVDELGFTVEEAFVGATPVATTVPVRGDRYMTFVLDEPFAYEGGNLLVECKVIAGGSYGTTYYWVQGFDYNPGYYEYDSWGNMVGYAVDYIPAATFNYNPAEVDPVDPVDPSEKTGAPTFHGYTEDGIYAYFVEIIPTEPSTIYYRVQVGHDGEFSEWMEYEDLLSFTEEGWYRIEAYAVADGKAQSEQIAYEFVVAPRVGIDEMVAGKTVAGVRYFNMAGQEMTEANGLTIVVTTYTDGTTSAVKVVK